jgi:hypothetical protein
VGTVRFHPNGGDWDREYLSYVWLLLWFMGMETVTVVEKMKRTELQAQGDIGATGPKSASLGTTTAENIA